MYKLEGSQVMPTMHVMMQVAQTVWQVQQASSRSIHTSTSRANLSTHRTNIYQVSQDDEDLAVAFQASVEHKLQGSMHTHQHLTRLAMQTISVDLLDTLLMLLTRTRLLTSTSRGSQECQN